MSELNERHRQFVAEVAKGRTGTDAYAIAFKRPADATANVNASRLLAKANIQQALANARSEIERRTRKAAEIAVERQAVTVESLLAEAEEARKLAMEQGQPAAAVAAIKEKGVLAQVRVERSERKNTTDATRLTDAELDSAIAEALAREQAEAERAGVTH